MKQLITPNPRIPCQPGWCLQYVRQAFGLPARYGTATEAWEKSDSQRRDRNFPAGVWLPVWYGLANEPAGHVVLMAPDGSCYSTSDLGSTPHHHPDLGDLERYYAYYGMTLTYRGWTEDVASYPVIANSGIDAMGGTITQASEEDDMNEAQDKALGVIFHAVNPAPSARLLASQGDIDIITARQGATDALLHQVLEALGKPKQEPSAILVKGDTDPTVYAWDGGTGYRALGYDEFAALMASGAELRTVAQATITAGK